MPSNCPNASALRGAINQSVAAMMQGDTTARVRINRYLENCARRDYPSVFDRTTGRVVDILSDKRNRRA